MSETEEERWAKVRASSPILLRTFYQDQPQNVLSEIVVKDGRCRIEFDRKGNRYACYLVDHDEVYEEEIRMKKIRARL